MRPSIAYTSKAGAALAGMALITGAWSVAPAAPAHRDLAVEAIDVHGQTVRLTLVHRGLGVRTVTVAVRAKLVGGTEATLTSTATVFGSQKAFVHFTLPEEVREVIVAGMIVDDPSPF